MLDKQTFQNKDLVLKVTPNYDPKRFDANKYEAFLDALCHDREYQKEAIRIVLRYFLGGEYQNLRHLTEENYKNNIKLQEKYSSFAEFDKYLQMPDKLSCSLDHATGTGKSFVMYGIARIMLAEGAVDQVLTLCPSNTIEAGLTEKFRNLSSDKNLKDLLPENSVITNPRIINASSTIQIGDVCIENIHSTYANTKSSIKDSLTGKGERTLVLNDEAHHLMNPSDKALKKWKEFLLDPKYGFKYIVNVSGTCYIGNDYFTDVIHRFSLRESIENKFVKTINYVVEDSSGNKNEKFQKIYANHQENITINYRDYKPLTILITKDIKACRRVTEELIGFLADKEKTDKAQASEKVLIVTSHNDHKGNIPILRRVDDKENPIEWITSVSMLTEGWDVKNVFQIVPHEERAFNSKLLIAQVLGRGLRIPNGYNGQPTVTVFNHDNWSGRIKHLVDEVMEIEKRIYSYPVEKKEDYNFEIHQIDYEKNIEETKIYPKIGEYEFKNRPISYSTQSLIIPKSTEYETVLSGKREKKDYNITQNMFSVEEVANDIFNRLNVFDLEAGTTYSEKWNRDNIIKIIRQSLLSVNDKTGMVSEENRLKTVQAFGVIGRKGSTFPKIVPISQEPYTISTRNIDKSSVGVGSLRRDSSVFCDDYSISLSSEPDKKVLQEIDDDENLPKSAMIKVDNKYNFKTPTNISFTSSEPERRFVKGLIEERTAKTINAWIKSRDAGFYHIEYSWRKGEHPQNRSFNPDFFIKVNNDIIIVEIKMDNDITDENKAKLRYAKEHFARINDSQKIQRYYFKFLSPISYELFFKALREGTYRDFKSEVEAQLEE